MLVSFYIDSSGPDWNDEEKDYIPTKKRTNYIKKLIKEEARFLFGKTPTLNVQSKNENEEAKVEEINNYIDKILKDNL